MLNLRLIKLDKNFGCYYLHNITVMVYILYMSSHQMNFRLFKSFDGSWLFIGNVSISHLHNYQKTTKICKYYYFSLVKHWIMFGRRSNMILPEFAINNQKFEKFFNYRVRQISFFGKWFIKATEYFLKFISLFESTILAVNNGKKFHSNGSVQFLRTLSIVCSCKIISFKWLPRLAYTVGPTGVKSQFRDGQTTSALRLIMRSSITGRKHRV